MSMFSLCSSQSITAVFLYSSPEDKDKFYEALDTVVSKIPTTELILILGDFNMRVGADHELWPDVLGHHGIGKMNENG